MPVSGGGESQGVGSEAAGCGGGGKPFSVRTEVDLMQVALFCVGLVTRMGRLGLPNSIK